MRESFPLIVLWHQQTFLLVLGGCLVQDKPHYTLAVSNAEAILLLYALVLTTDKCAYVHIASFCFSLTCSNEYFFKNSYSATTAVFSEG